MPDNGQAAICVCYQSWSSWRPWLKKNKINSIKWSESDPNWSSGSIHVGC